MTPLHAALVGALAAAAVAVVAIVRLRTALRASRTAAQGLERRLARNNELERQLATSLDAMDLGVVLVRRDGATVFRNHAAERFIEARHGFALVEAVIRELCEQALVGESGEREVELFGPPPTVQLVRSFPLFADGGEEPLGALVMVEDVTETHRTDQVRRDFVANISHELRTPIGAIGLLAETIVDEGDPSTVQRLAERMCSESDRVARTIDDLMELSRIEFGDDASTEELAAASVVEEAVSRIRSAAEQNGISIEVVVGEGAVLGDRRQLTSAVYNLVDNAVKYSPAGSTVSVRSRIDDHRLLVEVEDRGIGIPTRDLDRIFERFYRVDRARSRGTGGTGLGLAIVRHAVANHGGTVAVSSREGSGSTFTLDLPLASPADAVGAAGLPEAGQRAREGAGR